MKVAGQGRLGIKGVLYRGLDAGAGAPLNRRQLVDYVARMEIEKCNAVPSTASGAFHTDPCSEQNGTRGSQGGIPRAGCWTSELTAIYQLRWKTWDWNKLRRLYLEHGTAVLYRSEKGFKGYDWCIDYEWGKGSSLVV